MAMQFASEQAFNDAVDARMDQRIDQRIDQQLGQRIIGNEMVSFVQGQVVAVLKSDDFRVQLELAMMPSLTSLENAVAQAVLQADTKIAEMADLMTTLSDRLGTSSAELDAMRDSGDLAFRQHRELAEAARLASDYVGDFHG